MIIKLFYIKEINLEEEKIMKTNNYKELVKTLGLNGKRLDRIAFFYGTEHIYDKYVNKSIGGIISKMIKAYDDGLNVSVKFAINQKGINSIPLEDVRSYNNPAHDYFILMGKVKKYFPTLDEYGLVRTSGKTARDALPLYYHSIKKSKYVSNHGAVIDFSTHEFDPLEVALHLPTLKFVLYSVKGRSIFDIRDTKTKFSLLFLLINLLEHYGFDLKLRISK